MKLQRIAILTNGFYPYDIGGVQKHSYYLAKYFAIEKITVDIYHPGLSRDKDFIIEDYFDVEELCYLNFIETPFPKLLKFPGHYVYASYLYSKSLFIKLKKGEKYNCIYAQGFTSWYLLRNNAFREQLVTNLHGLNMFQKSINIKNLIELFILRIPAKEIIQKSRKQVSLGGKLTDILHSVGAKKSSVIVLPNGVDRSWIEHSSFLSNVTTSKKLRLVYVGRYERLKGIEEFQEVINSTIDLLDYEVQFIGPIPIEKQLKHANVNYLGAIYQSDEIRKVLLDSDVLVCPSYSEGMPTVILEAMACGCAIIATDVGATNTMVNYKNGWLIKEDIVTGLYNAINEALILNESQMRLMKKASVTRVLNHFTWNKIINKTILALKENLIV